MLALTTRILIRLLALPFDSVLVIRTSLRGVPVERISTSTRVGRVVSVVGRFLEHSRIYYFRNRGDDEVYLGSADMMPRNLNRRFSSTENG